MSGVSHRVNGDSMELDAGGAGGKNSGLEGDCGGLCIGEVTTPVMDAKRKGVFLTPSPDGGRREPDRSRPGVN